MVICDDPSKLKAESRLSIKCDDCSSEYETSYRSWAQKNKLGLRDVRKGLKNFSDFSDFCPSCRVTHFHERTPASVRKSKMKIAGAVAILNRRAKVEADSCLFPCILCGESFTRPDRSWARKYCKDCPSPGKGWFNKATKEAQDNLRLCISEHSTGENNPRYGKPALHGKWTDLELGESRYRMRSRWEAAFAVFLFKNNISFIYEPEPFPLSNGTTLTIDFVIPEWECVVEVKGFWRDDAKEKFSLFCKEYEHLNPMLVGCAELQEFIGFSPEDRKKLASYIASYVLQFT